MEHNENSEIPLSPGIESLINNIDTGADLTKDDQIEEINNPGNGYLTESPDFSKYTLPNNALMRGFSQLSETAISSINFTPSTLPIKSFRKPKPKKITGVPKTRPAFVVKLWNMVNDPSNAEFIRWLPDGKRFEVVHREGFMKFVLPKYFKHNNFASFVRQLNMYGWHKVQDVSSGSLNSSDDGWQFENENFQKDNEGLLDNIVRNKSSHKEDDEEVDFALVLSELDQIKMNQLAITEDLRRVRQDNELLWKENYLTHERHKAQAETLDKIMRFLASVYGGQSKNLETQKDDRQPVHESPDIPSYDTFAHRPQLMLTQGHQQSESPIQEVHRSPSFRHDSFDANTASPATLFPELAQTHTNNSNRIRELSEGDGLATKDAISGLEDTVAKQGESINQVTDWLKNLGDKGSDDGFNVDDFLEPVTPNDGHNTKKRKL